MGMLRPRKLFQREINCTETNGPRRRAVMRRWRDRESRSLRRWTIRLSSLRSLVRLSRRVWAEFVGFFHRRCAVALNGPKRSGDGVCDGEEDDLVV